MSEWISVEDKLPQEKVRVLLFDNGGFGIMSGRLGSAGWYLEGDLDKYANVTHWMPLPEPPEQPK